MRKALGRRRDVVYTYSNDFMSLNVSMVDEFRIRQVREPEPNNILPTPSTMLLGAPHSSVTYV